MDCILKKGGAVIRFKKKSSIFQRVGGVRIIPISVRILSIFIFLILLSNFSTNFISMMFSQHQIIELSNSILVYQLTDIYKTASTQWQIQEYTHERLASIESIKAAAMSDFNHEHSIAMGVQSDGWYLFYASAAPKDSPQSPSIKTGTFSDSRALGKMKNAPSSEGTILFDSEDGEEYVGVYKYHPDWDCYFIRAERRKDLYHDIYTVFKMVSVVAVILTAVILFAGIFMLNRIFSNVRRFTRELYRLRQHKEPEDLSLARTAKSPIDLSRAPNDDITYLAANFNDLYVNTANLKNIFQKFVSKDIVDHAYREHKVELKGKQRELTVLFTDIENFTSRTEILGNEIISLLNVHYNSIISIIQPETVSANDKSKAFIGSLIGDAILGIFGVNGEEGLYNPQKSADAVDCAWRMTQEAKNLRKRMDERKKILVESGQFDEIAQKVYDAVRLEIGVGIDGGSVFYGNIGSMTYMANTVIGDNVNSASRIEGLTRIYHLPILVSDYVREEVCAIPELAGRYVFYEIDTVYVKGKHRGTKIYFPYDKLQQDEDFKAYYTEEKFNQFEAALGAYYEGEWTKARKLFSSCDLQVAKTFLKRMGSTDAPKEWSGIWQMDTK